MQRIFFFLLFKKKKSILTIGSSNLEKKLMKKVLLNLDNHSWSEFKKQTKLYRSILKLYISFLCYSVNFIGL